MRHFLDNKKLIIYVFLLLIIGSHFHGSRKLVFYFLILHVIVRSLFLWLVLLHLKSLFCYLYPREKPRNSWKFRHVFFIHHQWPFYSFLVFKICFFGYLCINSLVFTYIRQFIYFYFHLKCFIIFFFYNYLFHLLPFWLLF